jgi:hypothetical protein
MSGAQKAQEGAYRSTAPELPQEVLAWRKSDRAISPVAIVATIDADRTPRTAPFGGLRAVTPRLLRLCSWHGHDTYANLCRGGISISAYEQSKSFFDAAMAELEAMG